MPYTNLDLPTGGNVGSAIGGAVAPSALFIATTAIFATLYVYFHARQDKTTSKFFLIAVVLSFVFSLLSLIAFPAFVISLMMPSTSPSDKSILPPPQQTPPNLQPSTTSVDFTEPPTFLPVAVIYKNPGEPSFGIPKDISAMLQKKGISITSDLNEANLFLEISDVMLDQPSDGPDKYGRKYQHVKLSFNVNIISKSGVVIFSKPALKENSDPDKETAIDVAAKNAVTEAVSEFANFLAKPPAYKIHQ